MFEKLFKYPWIVARHKNAPMAEERARYLAHCAQQGYTHNTLRGLANWLLRAAYKLNNFSEQEITRDQIRTATSRWVWRQKRQPRTRGGEVARIIFRQTTTRWFRFLGRLHQPEPGPFEDLVEEYAFWMKQERGLASGTIEPACGRIRLFLRWYANSGRSFAEVRIADIDRYLAENGIKGWSRISVANTAGDLRMFFRYAGKRGWCPSTIADAIVGPRIFSQEGLPRGPAWEDVRRLFAMLNTDRPCDIRDRAILMLFAIYGLRAHEVACLRLEDIDWEHDCILLRRPKQRRTQMYPLNTTVGNALLRYLEKVRPPSPYREVFLKLRPPFRGLSRGVLYHVVAKSMTILGIRALHRGPHSLRHACATHLITDGLSFKEVGDLLGHRCTSATRTYAKVDLPRLREVAAFDLGGIL